MQGPLARGTRRSHRRLAFVSPPLHRWGHSDPPAPQAGTSGPARAPASEEPPLLPQAGPLASLPACLHVSTSLRAAGQPLARHVVSTPRTHPP